MALPNWTDPQVLDQLVYGSKWSSLTITYAFPTTASGIGPFTGYNEAAGFRPVGADQQPFFQLALQNWDDLIPQSFLLVAPSLPYATNLEFAYSSTTAGYAHAGFPTSGSAWFSSVHVDRNNSTLAPTIGLHGFETLLHEIGHALGLSHMGNYDAAYGVEPQPSSFQDSTVYSIMSYFGPSGPYRSSEVASADWTSASGASFEPQTPMLNDVLAIQNIYGASSTTRSGDTVYGFNSNITGDSGRIFDFTRNLNPILTIFDSAGNDTLNLSGWSTPSIVSLVPGVYSSANSMTLNLVIAYNAVIENAVGGGGADVINGNSVGNLLEGNGGNDQLIGAYGDDTLVGGPGNDALHGGEGTDTVRFPGSYNAYSINYNAVTFTYTLSGGGSGTDTVSQVEFFEFADATRAASQLLSSDLVAPTLASRNPADDATGINPSSNLVLTFSESVQPGSGNIVIFNAGGTVAQTIAVTDASQAIFSGSTLTINPAANLAGGSGYYLNMAAGVVKDLAGNAFAGLSGSTVYNFNTAATDTTAPTLNARSPEDNATGVQASANLVLTFSEPVQAGSGSIVIFNANGTPAATLSATDSARVSFSGSTVTIDPASPLTAGASYFVNIAAGAIRDLAGNAFAGIDGSTAYNFSTAAGSDTTAPLLIGLAPSDNASGVAVTANLSLTFNENVQAGSGNIQIFNTGGSLWRSIAVTDTSQVTLSGNVVTINPGIDLAVGGSYYVNVAAGAIRDQTGNGFGGIASTTDFNFSTVAVDDYAGDFTTTGAVAIGGNAVSGSVDFSGDNDLFAVSLVAGKTYVFELRTAQTSPPEPAGLSDPYLRLWGLGQLLAYDDDSAGSHNARLAYTAHTTGTYFLSASHYSAGTGAYTLTAVSADTSAPSLLLATPGNVGDIAPDADLKLYFSDNVKAGTGDVVIYYANGSVARTLNVADADQVSFSGSVMTLALAEDLPWSSDFYITMEAGVVTDTAGNAFAGLASPTSYRFGTTDPPISDDYPWSTDTTGTVSVGGAATTAVISFADDMDLFTVQLLAGSSYTFELQRTAGGLADPYLAFYGGPDVELIAYNDDFDDTGNARVSFTATAAGTYYLGAMDQSTGTGGYTLSATSAPDDFPWAFSTNGVVTVDGPAVAGEVEFASDADMFQVTLTAGSSYRFTLLSSATGGLEDPYLQLFDSQGDVAAYDDDSAGELNSEIVFTAPASGTYYLGATDFDSGVGDYTLSAEALADDYPDDTSTAGMLTINGGTAVGSINLAGDRDAFAVELSAGHSYVFDLIEAEGGGLADPYLELYGTSLELAAFNDDMASGNRNSQISYTATDTGTYYLLAQAFADETGLYTLSGSETADDDYPWDTATGGVVVVGDPLGAGGSIESVYDADLFAVTLVGGLTYAFELTAAATDGLADPYLVLFDPSVETAAEDDDGAGAHNSRITYTAPANGTYYLGAVDYDQGTGAYTLTAQLVVDDRSWNADTTGVVTVGGAATAGTIEVPHDADLFKVSLTQGQSYTFTLLASTDGLDDPLLRLYSPGLALLAEDDDGAGGLDSRISYTATQTGVFYLGVQDVISGSGGYTLAAAVASDTTAPTLASLSPADDAVVAGSANFEFTFSENVRAGSGNILIYTSGGVVVQTIAVDDTTQVTFAGNTMALNPAANLATGGSYFINLAAGVVEDSAGNDFAGLVGNGAYNFSVASGDDYAWGTGTTGTVAVGGAGSTGVIEAAGDQDLFAVTLATGTTYVFNLTRTGNGLADPYLYLFDPDLRVAASDDDGSGSVNARITYTATASGTWYLGSSDAGAGQGGYTLTATVAATPTLVSLSPVDGAGAAAPTADLVLVFSQAMQAGTGNIVIFNGDGTVARTIAVTDTSQVMINGSTVTINPATNLAEGGSYYLNMASGVLKDLAGTSFAGFSGTGAYNFSTSAAGLSVPGSSAADTLGGGSGNDTISGAGSDDVMTGGGGNDSVDGGSGSDRANFTGNRAQYQLAKSGAAIAVGDTLGGRDGSDTVQNVELLRFADRNVDLTMGARIQGLAAADLKTLEELYVGFFDRVPEAEGLGYWIGQLKSGVSLTTISNLFYDAGVQFGVYNAAMTNEQFIRQVYDYVLYRPTGSPTAPNAGEIEYWNSRLVSGADTKGSMVLTMLHDVHAFFETDPVYGFVASSLNNKAAVADYYAVQQGLSMNVQADNITFGAALADLITATDITAAINFIGVNQFSMV